MSRSWKRSILHVWQGQVQETFHVRWQVLQALHALPHLQLEVGVAALGALNAHPDTGNIVHRDLALDTASGTVSPAVSPEVSRETMSDLKLLPAVAQTEWLAWPAVTCSC